MPQVAVVINEKTYRMACDEGQEQHLLALAKRFDATVSQLKNSFGEIGDQRLTVMAGVMITDELVEMQKKLRSVEAELATLQRARDDVLDSTSSKDEQLIVSLNAAATRIENIIPRLAAPKAAE